MLFTQQITRSTQVLSLRITLILEATSQAQRLGSHSHALYLLAPFKQVELATQSQMLMFQAHSTTTLSEFYSSKMIQNLRQQIQSLNSKLTQHLLLPQKEFLLSLPKQSTDHSISSSERVSSKMITVTASQFLVQAPTHGLQGQHLELTSTSKDRLLRQIPTEARLI